MKLKKYILNFWPKKKKKKKNLLLLNSSDKGATDLNEFMESGGHVHIFVFQRHLGLFFHFLHQPTSKISLTTSITRNHDQLLNYLH